jgi:TPP-dependent pyruvate/acetoin dehydrogenase alpha subunit
MSRSDRKRRYRNRRRLRLEWKRDPVAVLRRNPIGRMILAALEREHEAMRVEIRRIVADSTLNVSVDLDVFTRAPIQSIAFDPDAVRMTFD